MVSEFDARHDAHEERRNDELGLSAFFGGWAAVDDDDGCGGLVIALAAEQGEVVMLAVRQGLEGAAVLFGDVGGHGGDPRLSTLGGKGGLASLGRTRLDRQEPASVSSRRGAGRRLWWRRRLRYGEYGADRVPQSSCPGIRIRTAA